MRHYVPICLRIPREVTVGVRLVMRRVMRVLGLSLMVMVVVYGIRVGVRGAGMWEEHKRRVSPSRMVNKHMRRGEEKGQNESNGEHVHSCKAYEDTLRPVKIFLA